MVIYKGPGRTPPLQSHPPPLPHMARWPCLTSNPRPCPSVHRKLDLCLPPCVGWPGERPQVVKILPQTIHPVEKTPRNDDRQGRTGGTICWMIKIIPFNSSFFTLKNQTCFCYEDVSLLKKVASCGSRWKKCYFILSTLVLVGQYIRTKVIFSFNEFIQFSAIPQCFQLRDDVQRYLMIPVLLHPGDEKRIFRK